MTFYISWVTRKAYEDLGGTPSVWLRFKFWLFGMVKFKGTVT